MEVLLAMLSGGVGTALVGGIFALIQWRLNRGALQCRERSRELLELKRLVGVLVEADRTVLYDRIKHLGKTYLARGYVTVEELEDLDQMHTVYHDQDKLGGNGFLDSLMKAVHALAIKEGKM